MVKFPLKDIQSTRTQRPTASSSYPYVEIALGDVVAQCTMQLQLEQVGLALAPILVTQPLSYQPLPWAWLQDRPAPGRAPGRSQLSAGDRELT